MQDEAAKLQATFDQENGESGESILRLKEEKEGLKEKIDRVMGQREKEKNGHQREIRELEEKMRTKKDNFKKLVNEQLDEIESLRDA